ncbi:hypothetical protein B4589_005005 [Halolamina sp. CBA1230]|uniref:hypothetical protein n=1 Tax=Halolamina sp. CBA1230 TaxID=1853690 RepID=UPI0009A14ACD|nr:hypothetical protein [Halolamina sp. CBA1230]QKY19769.1 hypothetical protein B4589_005005 [Halolamina sp. CBA1230]
MPPRDAVDTLLFGEEPALSAQLVRVAGGLFFVALFAHLPVRYLGSTSDTVVVGAVAVAMFAVAAGAAYVNDGLLVSIALAAGIGVGFYAPAILFELRDPGNATLWILAVGSFSSLVAGVLGFAVGGGARRLRE